MARPETIEAVRATCEAILARHGYELVELSLAREGRSQVLRITLDRDGPPVGIEEVASVSEEISRWLDAEDPIPGRYLLEVASAGIERPLVRPSDYVRFRGREVKVRCAEPIEGRRTFTGSIASAGTLSFVLRTAEGVVEIPYVAVARARLVVDWDRELKGLGGGAADRATMSSPRAETRGTTP